VWRTSKSGAKALGPRTISGREEPGLKPEAVRLVFSIGLEDKLLNIHLLVLHLYEEESY
jgi:hypothetical protein